MYIHNPWHCCVEIFITIYSLYPERKEREKWPLPNVEAVFDAPSQHMSRMCLVTFALKPKIDVLSVSERIRQEEVLLIVLHVIMRMVWWLPDWGTQGLLPASNSGNNMNLCHLVGYTALWGHQRRMCSLDCIRRAVEVSTAVSDWWLTFSPNKHLL